MESICEEILMAEIRLQRLDRLDLDEVCEMIADGSSLAQIGVKFDRSHRVSFPRTQENLGDFTLEDISSPAKNSPQCLAMRP